MEAESLDNWRVCSRHFVSRKPADLYDITNPEWLPTLNLGHDKECCIEQLQLCMKRYKRAEEREMKRKYLQMDRRMDSLIFWPERDALQKTMPQSFQKSFGKKVAVIIDCFEIFIERPSNLKVPGQITSTI